MNHLRFGLKLAPGLLALALMFSPLAVRADGTTGGKLSTAKEKYDTDKDGVLSPEEKAKAKEDMAAKARAAQEEELKQALEKYDANHNGKLDPDELAKMKADDEALKAARAEKLKRALAKYDANHNGILDPDELAKMKEDEELAAKVAKQQAADDRREVNTMRRTQERGQGKARTH